jgi:hypothetical protein
MFRFWPVLLFVLVLSSCAAPRVTYDYDRETDFNNYTTYAYFSDLESGLSPLDEKRLLTALDSVLTTKGLKFSEEPDILVDIRSGFFHRPEQSSVGVGVGGTGGSVGGGVSLGIPLGGNGPELEITFDFVDSQKKSLFWQAVATGSFKEGGSPEQKEAYWHKLVCKAFDKYPPKVKAP